MSNFTANKSSQQGKSQRERSGLQAGGGGEGGGVIRMHLNLVLCFCQSLFRVKL